VKFVDSHCNIISSDVIENSRFISTPSAFQVVTVNALYKLLTYLLS